MAGAIHDGPVAASDHPSADALIDALYAVALPVGLAFLSPELRYLRVNEALARLNGRPPDAHLGATLEEIVGPHAPVLRETLERVMATRRPVELELSLALPQVPDDVRAMEATYSPVMEGDELLGIGAVVLDVTGRPRLEHRHSQLLRDALIARAAAEAA